MANDVQPPPAENPIWAFFKNALVRKILTFVFGALAIIACGFLPVAAQGVCKTVVGGVQSIVSSSGTGDDQLAGLKRQAGAPEGPPCPDELCAWTGNPDHPFIQLPPPDGGTCVCVPHQP